MPVLIYNADTTDSNLAWAKIREEFGDEETPGDRLQEANRIADRECEEAIKEATTHVRKIFGLTAIIMHGECVVGIVRVNVGGKNSDENCIETVRLGIAPMM
jgi:hypothetical protein